MTDADKGGSLIKKLTLDRATARKILILIVSWLLLLVNLPFVFASPCLPGEGIRFHYRVQKLGATVINASLSIERGNPHYLVKAILDTTGVVSPFFRMHNRFSSYINAEGLTPWRYVKEVDQKGIFSHKKRYTDTLTFDSGGCKVTVERADPHNIREVSIPPKTYDPLAIFLKCFLESAVANEHTIDMRIYDGIKLREVTFDARHGEIATPLYGTVKAICLQSEMPFSSLGDKEGIIKIWYTDDERRFPVNISLELPVVGNVEFELEKVERW
jgi:hypothetical protein